jgi:hypothetical protein
VDVTVGIGGVVTVPEESRRLVRDAVRVALVTAFHVAATS